MLFIRCDYYVQVFLIRSWVKILPNVQIAQIANEKN